MPARGGGDQGVHDDRLLRGARLAPHLLLPGIARRRLEIGPLPTMLTAHQATRQSFKFSAA
jgi:hypothetical protein